MLNPERFGVVIAVDGRERFVFHSQLPRDAKGTLEYAEESLRLVVGRDFPHRIIDIAEWTAGFTLVAEHYGSDRIFLAGDAAHLFTPTAGFGYNTAVDDVVNLGWKLAAVCNGWGVLACFNRKKQSVNQSAIGIRASHAPSQISFAI